MLCNNLRRLYDTAFIRRLPTQSSRHDRSGFHCSILRNVFGNESMKMTVAATQLTICLLFNQCLADDLPRGVVNTQSPDDHSLTPAESLSRITVPDGFNVTLFAGEPDVRRPIAFDFDDRGRLWVVENYSHPKYSKDNSTDRVLILEDTDHDGQFDQRTVFYDKGRYLTGIAIGHGGVWLANTPELVFIPDRDQNDVPDGPPVAVLDGFQVSTNNVINNLHWGPDGWLYGAIGLASKSRIGSPGCNERDRTEMTRGIWRYHVPDKVFETVALGMVNPWGADFNEYGDLISSNTVLAHLWHILPGMYCERRASERDNPWAWNRIQSITNHLHWGGGAWQDSRNPSSRKGKQREENDSYHQHSVAGGGHAHCGAMIYLGDNWPKEYRGSFFTNNLHGNRINNDRLIGNGSTWTGVHADDVLLANDPWFRGMQIKYGPDGSVFVSDWHDFGECHDSDGSHRTSGRIYRIAYETPTPFAGDLRRKTNTELVRLQSHRNAWFGRRARRILQEREAAGVDLTEARRELQKLFANSTDEVIQLRAFWGLASCGQPATAKHLTHSNPHIRRWAIRLLVDPCSDDMSAPQGRQRVTGTIATMLTQAAANESHPKVRLAYAVALQRLHFRNRPGLAIALQRETDVLDPYIPLMTWYGMEPGISDLPPKDALEYAKRCRIPLLQQFIARRLAQPDVAGVSELIDAISDADSDKSAANFLTGLDAGLDGSQPRSQPANWPAAVTRCSTMSIPGIQSSVLRLSVLFGDQQAINSLRSTINDKTAATTKRESALSTLISMNAVSSESLFKLAVSDATLRTSALRALVGHNEGLDAADLTALCEVLKPSDRRLAVSVLVTRKSFAVALLNAVESGALQRDDVSPYALQQLQSFSEPEISTRVSKVWKASTAFDRAEELSRLTSLMTPDHLGTGSARAGRLVFQKNCARCHTLFGEGGSLAPDLTGSGRRKTDYVLHNLTDPSAQIDEAFRVTTLLTDDGRLLSGFIVRQNDNAITIRTQDAEVSLPMKRVDELIASEKSMMPDGMLRSLTDDQIRDLLVYLASEDQVALPDQ